MPDDAFEPRLESTWRHEAGFDVEWWHVSENPSRYEHRIKGTTMSVREEDLPNYGACYSFHCSAHPRLFDGFPAQVGATARIGDAWRHWEKEHVELQDQIDWMNQHAGPTHHAHGWRTPNGHMITEAECDRCKWEKANAPLTDRERIVKLQKLMNQSTKPNSFHINGFETLYDSLADLYDEDFAHALRALIEDPK